MWSPRLILVCATQQSKLHPLGVRSLTATSQFLPSVKEQEGIFEAGFDVVSAQLFTKLFCFPHILTLCVWPMEEGARWIAEEYSRGWSGVTRAGVRKAIGGGR